MHGSTIAGLQGNTFEIGDLLCGQVISMRYQKNELATFERAEMKTFCGINRKHQWFTVGNSHCNYDANRPQLIG